MNFITSFITAFCVSSVFIGILFLICPDGVMQKSVKYLLSLAFLLSIVTSVSLTSNGKNFDFHTQNQIGALNSDLEVLNAKLVYEQTLKKSGISFSEITIFTDKSEDGNIKIIKVVVKSDEQKEKIISALSSVALMAEVQVVNE